MTQEQKELLLKDLCARLPFGVKVKMKYYDDAYELLAIYRNGTIYAVRDIGYPIEALYEDCKPYLIPIASMTEEQCYKLASIRSDFQDCWKYIKTPIPLSICNFEQIDFFHKNHLDYRGLIPLGLAEDATGKNIY